MIEPNTFRRNFYLKKKTNKENSKQQNDFILEI